MKLKGTRAHILGPETQNVQSYDKYFSFARECFKDF